MAVQQKSYFNGPPIVVGWLPLYQDAPSEELPQSYVGWRIKLSKQEDGAMWASPEDFENWTMSLDISVNSVDSEYVKKQKYVKMKLTPRIPSPSRPPSLTLTNKQTLMLVSFSELMSCCWTLLSFLTFGVFVELHRGGNWILIEL